MCSDSWGLSGELQRKSSLISSLIMSCLKYYCCFTNNGLMMHTINNHNLAKSPCRMSVLHCERRMLMLNSIKYICKQVKKEKCPSSDNRKRLKGTELLIMFSAPLCLPCMTQSSPEPQFYSSVCGF